MARPSLLRSSWFKWALLALLLLAVALGVARALNKRQAQNAAASQAAVALQKAPVYELTAADVIRLQPLDLQQAVPVSGALKAVQTVQLKARAAGELQGLNKREGDPVRVGEVLARIDSTEALARVRQAEQQAQAARAQVAIAQRTQDNNQSLVKQGFISATALDTSSANLAAAEVNHRAALAALDIARKGLADTTLRSPIQGQVSARLAQNGERVALDGRILELVDLSGFELEAALPPADAAGVQTGQAARLTVEGLAQPVSAEVARINPSVQAASRSVLVYLRVPPQPGMRQGLFAQGQIEMDRLRAPAVPLSAVRNDKPEPYLQWLQDGRVVHRPVSLTRQARWNDEPVVVLDGADLAMQGALVLSARAGAIREGTEVRLMAVPAPAAKADPAAANAAATAAAASAPAAAAAGATATPNTPPIERSAMWFTQVSLRNPVFATMVMLAFVVLGAFSFQRLQVDQFPNIDFPVVVVTTGYPGASPEIVESEVSKKVEEAVNAIAGVNSLASRSYEGTSVVIIEFQLHVDGRKAAEDVREKLALLRPAFRAEVEEPRVLRFDPASRSIWSVAVIPDASALPAPPPGAAAPRPPSAVELTTWAEQTLKKRLENVRGVGSVTLVGGTRRAINIDLDPAAMEALGITADQVTSAVRTENQDLPVGTLKTNERERVVQVLSRMQNPQDFEQIVVARRGGLPVRLGQVARVSDGTEEVESLALYNGQRTLLLQVQKAQDENTIAVTDGLKKTLAALQAELPPGVRLEQIADGSRPIRVSVDNVRRTLVEGALLTVLIVFLFLNSWRSTVITGLTLPIALIGTFFFMNLFGFTINMITLMALTLSVGLLIDDAIVVRENIVRHVQMGKAPFQAAMEGTQEIGLAVLATTLSIVAVFLPIGFMGGIIGKFFHEFGITMVAAVLISMFVSFTLDPMLSSVWHDPEIARHDRAQGQPFAPATLYDKTIGRVTAWFDRVQDDLSDAYQGALRWSLRHKLATLALAASTFVGSLFMLPLLGSEFVPKADFSETSLSFHTPVGSSLQATEAKTREVEAVLRSFPEVRYTLSTINTGDAQGSMYATIYVRLVDRKDRTLSVDAMSARLRERLRQLPGITVTHVGLRDSVGGNKQVEFSLQGDDLAELERLTVQVMERIRPIVGLVDLDASVKPNKPTVDVRLRGDLASDAGLGAAAVANSLRTLVAGQTVGNWRAADGESYDVNVRLAPAERARASDLARLPFLVGNAADGSARVVRLDQVAEVIESTGPNQINRKNLNREVAISANVFGRSAGEVSADIRRALDATPFPPGYRYEFGGSTKNMQESFGYAVSALAMAIIFIYMILASQFQSFLQPLALMTSLPLTLIGVVLALLMFGSTMSMFSVIGVVLLMGLVTKNAILLVDFAIRARQGHDGAAPMDRESALLLAARVRLRPILATTLAMVFGMVPLAFALTEGSEQRAPMGQAVIGGVITSSVLTLVVVPVVYCYMDDLAQRMRRLLGLKAPVPVPAQARATPAQ